MFIRVYTMITPRTTLQAASGMKIAIRPKTVAESFISSASKIFRFQRLMPYWTLTCMTISASRPSVSGQASLLPLRPQKLLALSQNRPSR